MSNNDREDNQERKPEESSPAGPPVVIYLVEVDKFVPLSSMPVYISKRNEQ